MLKKRCDKCSGAGKIMGGGMIYNDCEACLGKGHITIELNAMKATEGYKSAKKRLKSKSKDLSDSDIEKVLDDELKARI